MAPLLNPVTFSISEKVILLKGLIANNLKHSSRIFCLLALLESLYRILHNIYCKFNKKIKEAMKSNYFFNSNTKL